MKEERLWEMDGGQSLKEHDFLQQQRPIQCDRGIGGNDKRWGWKGKSWG